MCAGGLVADGLVVCARALKVFFKVSEGDEYNNIVASGTNAKSL
jgi:hypothetical protein